MSYASLIPVNSYGDEPDYIDEKGHEVRYNKTKPLKQTNRGRFTVVEPFSSIHNIKEIKKTIRNLKPVKKTIVKNPEKFYELNDRQLGRFKVKIAPITSISRPRKPRSPSRPIVNSPSRPRSSSRSRTKPRSSSRPRTRTRSSSRPRTTPKFVKNPEKFFDLNEKQIGRFNVKIKPRYKYVPVIPNGIPSEYSNRFEIVDYFPE